MGDIVKLAPPEELVWVCGECGCISWLVHEANLECSHCHHTSGKYAEWLLPPPPIEVPARSLNTFTETGVDNSEFLMRSFIRNLEEDDIAVIIKPDGMIHTYNGLTENKLSRSWLKKHLRTIAGLLGGNLK